MVVEGETTINDSLFIDAANEVFRIRDGSTSTDQFLVDTDNGNTTINGTTTIYGSTLIDDSLQVNGAIVMNSSLNVSGITTIQGNLYVGQNGGGNSIIYFYDDSANNYSPSLQFVDNASTINSNSIAANTFYFSNRIFVDGQIETNGDITAFSTSDERLKDNITPIDDPLNKVLSISGNTFDWNDKSDKEGADVGVIAQEILKVLPEAVTTRDNGYLAVRYEKLIPLLIESIKELSSKVEDLEQKLLDK